MKFLQHRYGTVFYIFFSVFAAILITRLIPPIQSPDENVHLLRADMISHGQFLLAPGAANKGREGGYIDSTLIKFTDSMMGISGNGAPKEIALDLLAKSGQMRWSHEKTFVNAAGTGYYMPIIYAPHALGLFASRKLDLTMHASYELTRTLVVTTSLLILGCAFLLYTPNLLTLILLTTPMALFQLGSPTIDGLCAAMTILAIGLWLRVSSSEQYLNSTQVSKQEITLYTLVLVLCAARTNLLPTLLIPLALAVAHPSRQRIFTVGLFFILTLGWIAFGISTTYDSRIVRENSTVQILTNYLTNPVEFFELVGRTVSDLETRRFYRHSFFGILGWLDTPISKQAVRIFSAAVVIVAFILISTTQWRREWRKRLILLGIGVTGTLLIFFALAVSWTNYPADKISGIQGRYFLIPALFVSAAIGRLQPESKITKPVELIALGAFLSYSMYILTTTLAAQYRMGNLYY